MYHVFSARNIEDCEVGDSEGGESTAFLFDLLALSARYNVPTPTVAHAIWITDIESVENEDIPEANEWWWRRLEREGGYVNQSQVLSWASHSGGFSFRRLMISGDGIRNINWPG